MGKKDSQNWILIILVAIVILSLTQTQRIFTVVGYTYIDISDQLRYTVEWIAWNQLDAGCPTTYEYCELFHHGNKDVGTSCGLCNPGNKCTCTIASATSDWYAYGLTLTGTTTTPGETTTLPVTTTPSITTTLPPSSFETLLCSVLETSCQRGCGSCPSFGYTYCRWSWTRTTNPPYEHSGFLDPGEQMPYGIEVGAGTCELYGVNVPPAPIIPTQTISDFISSLFTQIWNIIKSLLGL